MLDSLEIKLNPFSEKIENSRISSIISSNSIPHWITSSKTFDLVKEVKNIERKVDLKKGINTLISQKKQIMSFLKIFENPNNVTKFKYLYVIGGYPYETHAMVLAFNIFLKAFITSTKIEDKPLWLNFTNEVLNSQISDIIDNQRIPQLIIMSNIHEEMTPYRLDRIRDFLYIKSNIIMVVGSYNAYTYILENYGRNIDFVTQLYSNSYTRRMKIKNF